MTTGYSIAIRTLGTSPDSLKKELESIYSQTVLPRKVVIYIAHGYPLPDFRVGDEIYIPVRKGMVAQRALQYHEIDSEYIMMLDDDVVLDSDAAARMLSTLTENGLDAVVADVFMNHRLSSGQKIVAFVTNGVRPMFCGKKATRVYSSGAFGYINNPKSEWYPTESGAGPASLWKKSSWLKLHIEDELWMDRLGFAYGDDQLIFNKAYKNGLKTGMLFNSGCTHMDAKSTSGQYHADKNKLAWRTRGIYLLWHRSCYNLPDTSRFKRLYRTCCFTGRMSLILMSHAALSLRHMRIQPLTTFFKGIKEGRKFSNSKEFRTLPPYILK
ncbi:MAG: hypothetical protein Q4F07_02515 [Bacteroidales bacterium]|nr:hypothetical protein [Bacteroidales bacterium]